MVCEEVVSAPACGRVSVHAPGCYSCVSKTLEVNKHIMKTCIVNCLKPSHHLAYVIGPINMSDVLKAVQSIPQQ